MEQDEVWKPVVGYEGYYEVSDRGNIYSHHTDKVLRASPNSNGYPVVGLVGEGGAASGVIHFKVHRLVAFAFLGKPPMGQIVCHNDGNKQNCRLDNLRYASHKENSADRLIHGTSNRGKKNQSYKLTDEQVFEIRGEMELTWTEIAEKYDLSYPTIWKIRSGKLHKRLDGEVHGLAKLTADQVREIRSSTETLSEVAERYSIGIATAPRIRNRKSYRAVD